MTQVLNNEVLYKSEDGKTIIYKTYSQEMRRYGMLKDGKKGSRFADTTYRHIFPFQDDRAAAITSDNQYVWVDTDLQESEMDELDVILVEVTQIEGSRCNCQDKVEELGCDLCEGGVIFNELNWRQVESKGQRLLFEYDSDYSTFNIVLTASATFANLMVDEVWEEVELYRNIRLYINNHKEELLQSPKFLHVCVLSRSIQFSGVKLTPCSLSVELISVPAINNQAQNSYFFNYTTFINNSK